MSNHSNSITNGSHHSSNNNEMNGRGGGSMHPLEMDEDEDDGIIQEGPMDTSISSSGGARGCAVGCRTFTVTTINVCHPLCTVALGLVVAFMGLQLRDLQQQVADDEVAMAALADEITKDQATQQDLGQRVEQEHSLTLYQMAGTFTLLTCLITTFHITQHLSNFHEAVVQRKILAILWMRCVDLLIDFVV